MAITGADVLVAAEHWGLSEMLSSTPASADKLAAYSNLLLQWNTRFSLTAIRSEAELIERHLMEGVFAAAHHPPAASALDFGSGTGIPGIAVAICRTDLAVTLAESQRKKAAFLQETVRQLHLKATVFAGRAETLSPGAFDAVWMRAVEKSATMLPLAAALVAPTGTLCVLGTTVPPTFAASEQWQWKTVPLARGKDRVLHIGQRQ